MVLCVIWDKPIASNRRTNNTVLSEYFVNAEDCIYRHIMTRFFRFTVLFSSIVAFQLLFSATLYSQYADDSGYSSIESESWFINRAPTVFLDCSFCNFNYIRNEINYVNYVRDPEQADIHVFITQTPTVRGGAEFKFSFIGLRTFSSIRFDLAYVTSSNYTEQEVLDALIELSKAGLAPFLSQTPLAASQSIGVDLDEAAENGLQEIDDPWNYWMFEAYVGSVRLNLQSNRTDFISRWGIFADRVTDNWKLRFRPYFNYNTIEIRREGTDRVFSEIKRHGLDSYAIKSINDHWSAGVFIDYVTRNDRNIRHDFQVRPGVEYSFLPYPEATRRSITLQYQIGYTYANYFEETIYGVEQENLFKHQLRGAVNIRQPWGNVSGGMIGSHYFHDAAFRRAVLFGGISFRITEGLSMNLSANFQMIQDQLTLPAGDASLEDILLRQRELATDYNLNASFAITYSFGSRYANIVNTRFI